MTNATTKDSTMNTQLRAICPACFRQHAVRSGCMVQHGYERPEGWHANVNQCAGTNQPHFGTPAGRDFAKKVAADLRIWAKEHVEKAQAATVIKVVKSVRLPAEDKFETLTPASPRWAEAHRNHVLNAEYQARNCMAYVADIEKRVAAWTETAPVEVKVQPAGTILHAVGEYWTKREGRPIAACVSSIRAAGYKPTTDDHSKVTCRACLKQLAAQAADKIERAAAMKLIDEMVAKYGESAKRCFTDANTAAIRELRYNRKELDKNVRKRATDMLERGIK